MSKFINVDFFDGSTYRGIILNVDAISTYREDESDNTKTLVTTIDSAIPKNPILKIDMSESAFTAEIAGATDSPHSFIMINCGNPITANFFNCQISVKQLSAVSYCIAPTFSSYNQIYMPNLGVFLCTSTSLATIFTDLYA